MITATSATFGCLIEEVEDEVIGLVCISGSFLGRKTVHFKAVLFKVQHNEPLSLLEHVWWAKSWIVSILRQVSWHTEKWKPFSKNWAQGFEKRHPGTHARRVKTLDWNCYEKNAYWKTMHWFKVIRRLLNDPSILKLLYVNKNSSSSWISSTAPTSDHFWLCSNTASY